MATDNVTPSDSFILIYQVLTITGFCKHRNKPKYKILGVINFIQRWGICVGICGLNRIQQILFMAQAFDENIDKVIECLLIFLPQINMHVKFITVNQHFKRLEHLQEVMNDPIFAAKNDHNKEQLRRHNYIMDIVNKVMILSCLSCCLLWIVSTFISRMNDDTFKIGLYVPFDTKTMGGFTFSALFVQLPLTYVSMGHITSDCLFVCLYAQAAIQAKMIKHNLVHLADSEKVADYYGPKNSQTYHYIDDLDSSVADRFKYYVRRYLKLLWFVKEANAIFFNPVSIQMFITSTELCLDIYMLSKNSADIGNSTFYISYFFLIQFQIFVFCYCGELVEYETQSMADAIYQSDWHNLSPKLRKMIVIAMTGCWNSPITSKVAYVVPLSLNTYFMIMRAAFNLHAVMKSTNE